MGFNKWKYKAQRVLAKLEWKEERKKGEKMSEQLEKNWDKDWGGEIHYMVIARRKSDGNIYHPVGYERPLNGHTFEVWKDALKEAERKARECSKDYTYIVISFMAMAEAKRAEPPVEISYF